MSQVGEQNNELLKQWFYATKHLFQLKFVYLENKMSYCGKKFSKNITLL